MRLLFAVSFIFVFFACSKDPGSSSPKMINGKSVFDASPSDFASHEEILSLEGYQILTSNISELFQTNNMLRDSQKISSCFALKSAVTVKKKYFTVKDVIMSGSIIYENMKIENEPGKLYFFSDCQNLEDFGDRWYSGITSNNIPTGELKIRTFYPADPSDAGYTEIFSKISVRKGSSETLVDVVLASATISFSLGLNYLWFDHFCGLAQNLQDENIVRMAVKSDRVCEIKTEANDPTNTNASEFAIKEIKLL